MSNVNAPYGARLVGHRSGSPYNARVRPYVVVSGDSTPLFVGDFVVMSSGAGTTNELGVDLPACTQATAQSTALLGVVVAFIPNPANLYSTYRGASTLRTALVCDDPDALFEIQANGTATLTDACLGKFAGISLGTAGSTIWGSSGMTLDSNTVSVYDALLRIEGLSQRPGNTIGVYSNFICSISDHEFNQHPTEG